MLGLFNPVDAGNVGMIERRQHARLALESREPIGVRREDAREDLDRDVPSEPRIVGAVHLAHPAGAKRRHDVVLAESIAGGQAGRGRAARIACGGRDAQCGQQRLGCGRPLFRQRQGRVVGREQRFDIAAQRFIARDRSRDERGPLGRRLFDRGFEQPPDAQPSAFGHERRRATRRSRFTA